MKSKTLWGAIALLCPVAFLVGRVTAEEGGWEAPAWTKKTDEHEAMKKRVGEWNVKTKWWMDPSAPPKEGTATTRAELILGGYYLQETFKADFMGQPFEGRHLLGYDTIAKEYVSVWSDNMNPVPSISRGNEKDGVVTMHGMNPDWGSDKKIKQWTKLSWDNDDQFTFRFYRAGPDGEDFKTGEFVYTRKK